MKTNIVTELQRDLKKRKEQNATNPVIGEVQKLIEYDTIRDSHVLDMLAPNSSLSQSKKEMGAIIELEKKEDFYAGEVFTKKQIVHLAQKYRLKFLQSEHYSAYLDPKIVLDIRDLERAIGTGMVKQKAAKLGITVEECLAQGEIKYEMDAHQLKTKFFILAPAKCFNTEKKSAFKAAVPDPIMFYTDDEIHFRLIRKWGTDFTIFRRIKGFVTSNQVALQLCVFCLPITILTLTLCMLFSWWFAFMGLINIFGFAPWDWENDFFGKRYVTSKDRYWI